MKPWKYNNTKNNISFSANEIYFIFIMTPVGSTNDENTCVELFKAIFSLNDQTTHQRKNLKLPYLHFYTRSISEIWRVET